MPTTQLPQRGVWLPVVRDVLIMIPSSQSRLSRRLSNSNRTEKVTYLVVSASPRSSPLARDEREKQAPFACLILGEQQLLVLPCTVALRRRQGLDQPPQPPEAQPDTGRWVVGIGRGRKRRRR